MANHPAEGNIIMLLWLHDNILSWYFITTLAPQFIVKFTEKEKFNQMVAKNQADIQNLQATLYEESQARLKLSMELDTKESEVENLQMKLTHINLDAESISSGM